MSYDPATISSLTRAIDVAGYVRVIPARHIATPLGIGPGRSRFSSQNKTFNVLYLARSVGTAIAETIIRDRFEEKARRVLTLEELDDRAAVTVRAVRPLSLLDLSENGPFLLGVSTDATGAQDHRKGRSFSQWLYDNTDCDGILFRSRLTREMCAVVYDRALLHVEAAHPPIILTRIKDLSDILKKMNITNIVHDPSASL